MSLPDEVLSKASDLLRATVPVTQSTRVRRLCTFLVNLGFRYNDSPAGSIVSVGKLLQYNDEI